MSFVVEKLRQIEVKRTCLRPQGQPVKGLHPNLEARALCPMFTHWRASHRCIFTSEGDTKEDKTQISQATEKSSSNGIREQHQ